MDVGTLIALLVGLAAGLIVGRLVGRPRLVALTAALDAERRASADAGRLREQFAAASAEALERSTRQLAELADARLQTAGTLASNELETGRRGIEQLVAPLRDTLARVEGELRAAERQRVAAQAALLQQVDAVRSTGEALRRETAALVTALRKPQTRGRWGELQLRRVVEVAGMVERCDFELQTVASGPDGPQRPDMIVRLAGGKQVVVDAKVPLEAFLEAVDAAEETVRAQRLGAHARQLRAHVDALAAKAYWQRFAPTPEFVVLFVPGEAFLAAALEADPTLLEHAAAARVVLATPTTLIALLRTVAYAWSQEALTRNAQQVHALGRELHERLSTLGGHVDRVGRALGSAVAAYNSAVGSLESRVLVTARRLSDLQGIDRDIAEPMRVDIRPRAPSAPELTDDEDAPVVALAPADDLPSEAAS